MRQKNSDFFQLAYLHYLKVSHLTPDIDSVIKHHINQRVTAGAITNFIRETYGKTVSEGDI